MHVLGNVLVSSLRVQPTWEIIHVMILRSLNWSHFCIDYVLFLFFLFIEAEVIYASVNYTIIVSNNCLLPGRRQAIIWTNAGILLIECLGTNLSEIFIKIHTFSYKKMHSKMLSEKWQLFCLGPQCLNIYWWLGESLWLLQCISNAIMAALCGAINIVYFFSYNLLTYCISWHPKWNHYIEYHSYCSWSILHEAIHIIWSFCW